MELFNDSLDKIIQQLTEVHIRTTETVSEFSYNGAKNEFELGGYLDQLLGNVEKEIRHNLLNMRDLLAKEHYLKTIWSRSEDALRKVKYINDWFTLRDDEQVDEFMMLQLRPDGFVLNIEYVANTFDMSNINDQYFLLMQFRRWKECSLEQTRVAKSLASFIYHQDVSKCLGKNTNEEYIAKNQFQISQTRGAKTDLIKILYAMHQLNLVAFASNGTYPTLKEFMEKCGNFFGTDLKEYSSNMALFKSTKDESLLKVFEKMKSSIINYSRG